MLIDTWTAMRKELKEALILYGSGRFGILSLLIIPLMLGVFLPLPAGRAWVESPIALVFWVWLPPFLVMTIIADSFAGERERHTLETLLASRLPDGAILLGKIAAAVAYAWVVALLGLVLGVITVNIAHWQGDLVFYPLVVTIGAPILTFLTAGLAATGGVFVSLRAATVRQVQQGIGVAILLVAFLPSLAALLLPASWLQRFGAWVLGIDQGLAVLVVCGVLVLLNAVLLAAAINRFRRDRLMVG
jgi:ABC-2 type transport system permease protein